MVSSISGRRQEFPTAMEHPGKSGAQVAPVAQSVRPAPARAARPTPGMAGKNLALQQRLVEQVRRAPAEPAEGAINLHSIWVPPSRKPGAANLKFRQLLVGAYLDMANDAGSRPGNVEANLWTTRPIDLLKPVFLGDSGERVELEIPHSMLVDGAVMVRDEADLLAHINALPDPDARQTLQTIYHHPAMENIGFRADVLRLLIGILHTRHLPHPQHGKVPTVSLREANLYADVDQVATAHRQHTEDAHQELTERESRTRALYDSVHSLALPPDPGPCNAAQLRALASAPQRSWSGPPSARPGNGAAVPIPVELADFGLLSREDENDLVAILPMHPAAIGLAKTILQVLDTHTFTTQNQDMQALFEDYQWHALRSATIISALRTGAPPPTDGNGAIVVEDFAQSDVIDMFRFAEKLRQLRPVLLDQIEQLQAPAMDGDEAALEKIFAIEDVHRWHIYLIDAFVNMGTYLPQIEHSAATGGKPLGKMAEAVLGGPLDLGCTSGATWKGGLHPLLDERLPTPEIAILKAVYQELRALMESEQVL